MLKVEPEPGVMDGYLLELRGGSNDGAYEGMAFWKNVPTSKSLDSEIVTITRVRPESSTASVRAIAVHRYRPPEVGSEVLSREPDEADEGGATTRP